MNSQLLHEVMDMLESEIKSKPLDVDFEMAYQVRVVIDRIRFAIKVTDQSMNQPSQLREVALQLLDALDRLESADRSFQGRFRRSSFIEDRQLSIDTLNGHAGRTTVRK